MIGPCVKPCDRPLEVAAVVEPDLGPFGPLNPPTGRDLDERARGVGRPSDRDVKHGLCTDGGKRAVDQARAAAPRQRQGDGDGPSEQDQRRREQR
jgi:hypothetical protein